MRAMTCLRCFLGSLVESPRDFDGAKQAFKSGQRHADAAEHARASELFEQCIRLAPDEKHCYAALAKELRALGRMKQADACMREFARIPEYSRPACESEIDPRCTNDPPRIH